jgi:uncharacterized membrane protein
MPNLHPFLSGLPSAFALLAVVLEAGALLGIWKRESMGAAITTALVASCLAVSAAFLSGYHAVRLAAPLPERIEILAGNHHAIGRAAFIVAWMTLVVAQIWKRATHDVRFFAALYGAGLLGLLALTLLAGNRGGKLIFDHGVGVKIQTESLPPASKDTPASPIDGIPTSPGQTTSRSTDSRTG